ncbi:methyl-accepting chemotaxis protein [Salinilacihabitans rarus]|uniref:methyl-accepting chemotaxis protein n=1 Tax=Salinilacihabitans rarus TaxID=2961596 RepID=UPI0020C8A21B|nr:methyl-accepting chemotaxis protein [Salinilacihabitans rarus]
MSILTKLAPSFVRRRYLAKFVISILTVVLVIGAVGAVSYAEIDETVRSDANAQLESTAEMQAGEISSWMESLSVQTRTASASPILAEGDPQAVQGHLVEEQARMGVNVRAIHYVDTDSGEIVTSTNAAYRETSFDDLEEPWADRDFDEEFDLDEEVWYSESAYESPTLGDQVMAFASPVTDRDDRAVVVIGTLEYQIEQLQQENTSASTVILDADGTDVFQTGETTVDDVDEGALEAALGGRLTRVRGDDAVQAYVPVSNTQWVAVTSVPTEQAYGVAASVGTNVLVMVLVSLTALSLVGVVLGRQTVSPLTTLRDRAAEIEDGNLDVDLETNRIDEIGRLFEAFDSMRNSLRARIKEANEARREAETEREQSERMTRHLEQKAEEYRGVMEECADGDLTRRLDPESESEAMTDIALAFNEMVDQLEETTDEVKGFANEVATASEQVTASAEEVRGASQQVTESVQEISDGAERQNENLQAVNSEMGGLSTTTEQIAASSNDVADLAERTAETGRQGREAAREAIEGMREIEDESAEAVEAIEALEAEMDQIDELVEFISEVARETNMLALNANIEASRSGGGGDDDNGDGFSVVASEVKELAEDTKETAEDIEERLERIDERTERTATEVQRSAERISTHADSVTSAMEAFDEIAEYAAQTNDGVQEISAATEEQAAATQEVVSMVSTATDISDRTAAEAQNVAAAAEEQTSALTEVSRSASSLADRAVYLSETLDRFETDRDGAAPVDPEFEDDVSFGDEDGSFEREGDDISFESESEGVSVEGDDEGDEADEDGDAAADDASTTDEPFSFGGVDDE